MVLTNSCGAGEQREISDRTIADREEAAELTESPFHATRGWGGRSINLYVDALAPDHIVNATVNAAQTWNDAIGREVIKFRGRDTQTIVTDLYSPLADTRTTLFYVEKWAELTGKSEGVLGTTVWELAPGDSEQIVRADILLNAESYMYQDSQDAPLDVDAISLMVDSETVILHEMGHMLGSNHIDQSIDEDSVMHSHAMIGPNQYKRALSSQDIERIQELYN